MAEPTSKIPVKSEKRSSLTNLFGPTMPAWASFETLRREVDQLFDRFRESGSRLPHPSSLFDFAWPAAAGAGIATAVDVVERDKEYEITAELPGLDEKNLEVKLSNGVLLIKGEKKDEREEREKDFYLSERRYGSFSRSFQIPAGVDLDKIEAHFSKGVLSIKLPKSAEAMKNDKTIEIKAA